MREDGASFAIAFVAHPKDKGKHVLQGSSSFCVDTMEDMLHKGLEQALTKAGSEWDELVESPIKENIMPLISIVKKE